MSDEINPPHYKQGDIECITAIKAACSDGYEGYLQGNIIKYIWRYRYKGKAASDLNKAKWYLEELIKQQSE